MKLYLFDFDGTISSKDSMIHFFLFIYPKYLFILKFLACTPLLFLYCLGVHEKDYVKSEILKVFLAQFSKNELNQFASQFSISFDQYLKKNAKSFIADLVSSNSNKVYVVSASLDIWMEPIAKELNVHLISTRSLFQNERFDGISGKNLYGGEKATRIQEVIDLNNFEKIYAFGDTSGDFEMLELADHKYFKYF
ncbi:haloacid dehalogenase-like hydrolase [Gammaproteobacteria bacterium]|nr:haloacid dehalogenase-like hydrolase [Gammaproteobacteria bacterium]